MASSAPARDELAHVRIVRELGTRSPGTYLGRHDDDRDVVLETYAGLDAKSWHLVMDSAQRLRTSPKHPHLVSVIAADRIAGSISIVTDFVDGLPLEEVFFGLSLGARLRAVVDILSALSALHMVPDGRPIVHGGILLRSAFAEKTGRTKLGFAYRQALCFKKDSYAPEMLLGDEAAVDVRTDVYGAGVLLWEAINGHALFGDAKPEDIVREQLAGRIAKPHVAAHDRWAGAVLPVIDRALSLEPKQRYATIAEMAAALRIAVRARLMTHEDVVEELWPAETKPKITSGIVPVADPMVADAAPQSAPEPAPQSKLTIDTPPPVETPIAPSSMEPAPLSEGAASGIVAIPLPEPIRVAAPAPIRRSRTFIVFALAAGLVAAAVTFAHLRVSQVSARPDATPDERAASSTASASARPVVEGEDTTPTVAPAASGTTAPVTTTPTTAAPRREKAPKHPAAKPPRAAYDPLSI